MTLTGPRLERDARDRAAAIVAAAERMRRGNTLTREVVPPTIQAQLEAHQREIAALKATLTTLLTAIHEAKTHG